MTLVAGFVCGETVVLCADSQETVGNYKVAVDKILPREVGIYDLVFMGAGHHGMLVDTLDHQVRHVLSRSRACSTDSVLLELQCAVTAFYEGEVCKNWPCADPEDKVVRGIACVRMRTPMPMAKRSVFLFHLYGSTVLPIETYQLEGMDFDLYHHIAERLYRPDLSIQQTILLGLRLFRLAMDTSSVIGGDIRIVIAQRGNMLSVDSGEIKAVCDGMDRIDESLDRLLLACPDRYLSDSTLQEQLDEFGRDVMSFRKTLQRDAVEAFYRMLKREGIDIPADSE